MLNVETLCKLGIPTLEESLREREDLHRLDEAVAQYRATGAKALEVKCFNKAEADWFNLQAGIRYPDVNVVAIWNEWRGTDGRQ